LILISKFHNKITTAGAASCTRLTIFLSRRKDNGVAKSPPYGVMVFFQDLDIKMYAFAPEKTPSLAGRNFCLAIT
jgi:hypothetical protein